MVQAQLNNIRNIEHKVHMDNIRSDNTPPENRVEKLTKEGFLQSLSIKLLKNLSQTSCSQHISLNLI